MKATPGELEALARRARRAGGKVLGVAPEAPAPAPQKPSKYRNVRAEYAGQRYDSKAEAAYAELLDLEAAATPGMLWIRQVRFCLGCPENTYRADFFVYRPIDDVRAVDVKGHRTAKFEHDVKLWRAYGPCPLEIVSRRGQAWSSEIIEGGAGHP